MTQSKELNDILHPLKEEALESWARRVRENREQAERFREAPERPDFYAPTAHIFKADPRRTDEKALNILASMLRPEETWLDIGAGAGRYALPLALKMREVIAIEPSQAMRENLRKAMIEYGISNVRIIEGRWPVKDPPQADVAMISHLAYDIEDIGPFLDAMESSARRLCIAILLDRAPTTPADFAWPVIHGEKRASLPSLREFLVLQIARDRLCEVKITDAQMHAHQNRGLMPSFLRQQLFIEPGGKKDLLLQQLIEKHSSEQTGQTHSSTGYGVVGIVSWKPPHCNTR